MRLSCMQTRMEKYTEAHEEVNLRYKRNEELYKRINEQELEKFTIKNNATVLGDNTPNIDVEHIKKILETKYSTNTPQRKSISIPTESSAKEENNIIETKEYDINLILEKAKENTSSDYNNDRYKRIHDTQYDILKDLNISSDYNDEKLDTTKDELRDLINTITQKELENKQKNSDPFDLFPDLKGSDNTQVLSGMKEEIENDFVDNGKIDDSFYTSSVNFTQSDFDDFDDLKREVKGHKVAIIVVTVLIIIAILFAIFIILNNMLGLNII